MKMRHFYSILFLTFSAIIPYGTHAQTSGTNSSPGRASVPDGVISYKCIGQDRKSIKVPIADAKPSIIKSCQLMKTQNRLTNFPKKFKPAYGQIMSAQSQSGPFYMNPINEQKFPNIFSISSNDCGLAAVMIANTAQTQNSALQRSRPLAKPANSVRTRPSLVKSVRTRPAAPPGDEVGSKARAKRALAFGKGDVSGAGFRMCEKVTYDWNADVSGTGRRVGSIPVPGSRNPI
ncbi:hypothetical protein HI914_02420 [Erysiphe necator]|uniref:Eka-like protein n=1 Tax=Uncinula necator TaxID=52586 RepID=A0A0B1P9D2_UNCNE|nr:hypothetical protein HI914_02420 [Erysiphe necator]KHJ33581.1 hypothetical protein EV44_g0303 [Erysiphe necator]